MITKYKNITVSKASDGGAESKLPTHRLVVSNENYEHKKDVGSFWTKEGSWGKFLSGKMGDARSYVNKEGQTVEVPGYVIVREDELDALIAKVQPSLADIAEAKERKDFVPNVNEDLSDIPF